MKHKNTLPRETPKSSLPRPVKARPPRVDSCQHLEHLPTKPGPLAKIASRPQALERTARLFFALGDEARLRLLVALEGGERCVGDLVETLGEKFSTVSQRLRLLRAEGLVKRRRDGNHLHYALSDNHVSVLLRNALEHAAELSHEISNSGTNLDDPNGSED